MFILQSHIASDMQKERNLDVLRQYFLQVCIAYVDMLYESIKSAWKPHD